MTDDYWGDVTDEEKAEIRKAHERNTVGIYEKFRVERTDGRSASGEKHDGCRYFVLDMDHDSHAIPALRAYEESCRSVYPQLAHDLHMWLFEQSLADTGAEE